MSACLLLCETSWFPALQQLHVLFRQFEPHEKVVSAVTCRSQLMPAMPAFDLRMVAAQQDVRHTPAIVLSRARVVWILQQIVGEGVFVGRIGVAELTQFFEKHGDVAFPFYHNLLGIVTDKVRRDTRRLDEMRANLIRTQKAMKKLLETVLESEETPLSKTVCETLEDLIEHNRRVHYLVEPARSLASSVRLDGGGIAEVLELSATLLRITRPASLPAVGTHWSGVLVTPAGEVPVSGTVDTADATAVLIKLDLFIEQYASVVRDYLTRVQMLDFVV